jgi:hypothetical protein
MSNLSVSPYESLKSGFRRACVRRLVGDEKAAIGILRDEIPNLVVAWAKSSDLDASSKKTKLKELFDDESSRADELATAFDLFAARFEVRVAELVKNEVSSVVDQLVQSVRSIEANASKLFPLSKGEGHSKADNTHTELSAQGSGPRNLPDPTIPVASDSKDTKTNSSTSETSVQAADAEVYDIKNCRDSMVGEGLRFDEIEEMIDEILISFN